MEGRVEGRKTETAYEIRQGETLLRSIPLAEAMTNQKLARVIKQNKWEKL